MQFNMSISNLLNPIDSSFPPVEGKSKKNLQETKNSDTAPSEIYQDRIASQSSRCLSVLSNNTNSNISNHPALDARELIHSGLSVQVTFINGDKYEGGFSNGQPHGNGKFVFSNGDILEGTFIHGKIHGKARTTFKDGRVYEGHFSHGKRIQESEEMENVDTNFSEHRVGYEGELANGIPHGKGRLTLKNGNAYEGEFFNGKRHGKGKQFYQGGAVFEGIFVNDQPHGKGTLTDKNGNVFECDLNKNHLQEKRK